MELWSQPSATRSRRSLASLGMLVMLLTVLLLSACSSDADQARARQSKAKLDQEITHARTDLGLPTSILQPVLAQEQKVSSGEGGLFYNYGDAAANYELLYNQLVGIEQTAQQTLKQQAQADMQSFASILSERQTQGFSEIATYQARYGEAQQQFDDATKPGDYARVSELAQAQTQALQAMWPAYQRLQAFKAVLDSLRAAGVGSPLGQQFYDQDVQVFRNAASAERYTALQKTIDGQTMQLIADQTSAQPYVTGALLQSFQARIDLLRQYGDKANADTFQQQHDADQQQLGGAKELADYLTLAQTIGKQNAAVDFPLAKAKAYYDLGVLKKLVAKVNQRTVHNAYDNVDYPIAYEYADKENGIGDVEPKVIAARTLAAYQAADARVLEMTTTLRALVDNYDDPTPHDQVHKTDLDLMRYFNITVGKVIMISLREQTARFYENGALVNWYFVTTGRPGHTSVPGLRHALGKVSPTVFKSPYPPGSPDWYADTPINYAVYYEGYTYFLHDAWWRRTFGPGTEFPHRDPAAFDGGSHGCINFSLAAMTWVYKWVPEPRSWGTGIPIVLY